jgi:tRNA A37 threonylcarbamoyladenosine synthetase subunit TsaC/SUA5/YrdC
MLGCKNLYDQMTFTTFSTRPLSAEEWKELTALKQAINDNPATVHFEKMEKFSELMVRSLQERGG